MNPDNLVKDRSQEVNPQKEISYVVYETTNLVNSMIYVGYHITNDINDKYLGSGTYIRRAVKHYGKQNFRKKILYIFDNEKEMLDMEAEIVNEEFILRENTYNIVLGGGNNTKGMVSVKTKEGKTITVLKNDPRYVNGDLVGVTKGLFCVKDKNGNKLMVTKEDPRYISGELVFILKGTKHLGKRPYKSLSEQTRKKMSGLRIGKKKTEETKRKMTAYQFNRPKEHNLNISKAKKGKKKSKEVKENMSIAAKKRSLTRRETFTFAGKTHLDSSKLKTSITLKATFRKKRLYSQFDWCI
jgi:hypothetical protein